MRSFPETRIMIHKGLPGLCRYGCNLMGHQKPMSPEIINKGHATITVSAQKVSSN